MHQLLMLVPLAMFASFMTNQVAAQSNGSHVTDVATDGEDGYQNIQLKTGPANDITIGKVYILVPISESWERSLRR